MKLEVSQIDKAMTNELCRRKVECPDCHHVFMTPFYRWLRCPECGLRWQEAPNE